MAAKKGKKKSASKKSASRKSGAKKSSRKAGKKKSSAESPVKTSSMADFLIRTPPRADRSASRLCGGDLPVIPSPA